MQFGYARVSTDEQCLEAQMDELKAAGCERVLGENATGSSVSERPKLKLLLDIIGPGDVLIVAKLDRLARNTVDMLTTVEDIGRKGCGFRSLAEPWADTTTPAGELMLTFFAGVAQFERKRMLERQKVGIARARAAGKYRGRKRVTDPADVRELKAQGLGASQIARRLRCNRSTVYRALEPNSSAQG